MNSPTHTPLPRDPGPTEFLAESLSVHNRKCIGCLTHGMDTMISFARKGDPVVYDLFLKSHLSGFLLESLLKGSSRMDQIDAWENTFMIVTTHLREFYDAVDGQPRTETGMFHVETTIKHVAEELRKSRAENAGLRAKIATLQNAP